MNRKKKSKEQEKGEEREAGKEKRNRQSRPGTDHIAFERVLIALDRVVILGLRSIEQSVDVPAHVRLDVHGQTLLDQRVSLLLALHAVVSQTLHGKGL